MPVCRKCDSRFPNRLMIGGVRRNLCKRKYCLTCSPWGKHNTAKLHVIRTPCRGGPEGGHYDPQKNGAAYIRRRRKVLKTRLVDMKGGRCQLCGYCRTMRAMEFHHVIDETKSFELNSGNLVNRMWNLVLAEAQKTVLLCSNCHAEVEDGLHPEKEKEWRRTATVE